MSAAPVRAWISLGSNLGQARATLHRAIAALDQIPSTRVVAVSSFYRTAPVGADGPDYINAVAGMDTSLAPLELLHALQAIELAEGRERPYLNAPRTLDLDLLLHGNFTSDDAVLTVPHPRMYQRAFVLEPLAEVAPELVRREQLDALRDQRIERISLE